MVYFCLSLRVKKKEGKKKPLTFCDSTRYSNNPRKEQVMKGGSYAHLWKEIMHPSRNSSILLESPCKNLFWKADARGLITDGLQPVFQFRFRWKNANFIISCNTLEQTFPLALRLSWKILNLVHLIYLCFGVHAAVPNKLKSKWHVCLSSLQWLQTESLLFADNTVFKAFY